MSKFVRVWDWDQRLTVVRAVVSALVCGESVLCTVSTVHSTAQYRASEQLEQSVWAQPPWESHRGRDRADSPASSHPLRTQDLRSGDSEQRPERGHSRHLTTGISCPSHPGQSPGVLIPHSIIVTKSSSARTDFRNRAVRLHQESKCIPRIQAVMTPGPPTPARGAESRQSPGWGGASSETPPRPPPAPPPPPRWPPVIIPLLTTSTSQSPRSQGDLLKWK